MGYEEGGQLTEKARRKPFFGGAQVSRTFYARGQTGQQLLLGAYQALERQIHAGTVMELAPEWDRELMEILASGDLTPLDGWEPAWMQQVAGHSAHATAQRATYEQ